ncbi:MAG: MBL fold metallo-hydrolase [Candidatus Omnitrophica bacterium]|nr:MBL fold metallo-hydrolase [Candidatus Omnitrophota bacterium]
MKMNPKAKQKEHNFILERFVVGPLESNCYLVADPGTKEAVLIDPGADSGKMKKFIAKAGLDLKFIINTHGHGDHIAANGSFGVPIYIHSLDADFLSDPKKNLSAMFLFPLRSPKAARLLEEGDKITLGGLEVEVIHTPGHTPGSISLKMDSVIFTGDTLFAGGMGRTDFDYGDEEQIIRSIREKLFSFSDDTEIYPGHGEPSTIGEERRSNPFL